MVRRPPPRKPWSRAPSSPPRRGRQQSLEGAPRGAGPGGAGEDDGWVCVFSHDEASATTECPSCPKESAPRHHESHSHVLVSHRLFCQRVAENHPDEQILLGNTGKVRQRPKLRQPEARPAARPAAPLGVSASFHPKQKSVLEIPRSDSLISVDSE